ncbi:MAG: glycosyltransferase, partial [Acidimicrobiales bacterium]
VPPVPRARRPDAAADLPRYRAWLARREAALLAAVPSPAGPEIAVLLLVDEPDAKELRRTLRAMGGQRSARWHLYVTVLGAAGSDVSGTLSDELAELEPGIATVLVRPARTDPAVATALALEGISCPACVFLEVGDVLTPDAVGLLSAALVDADVAYGDEDRIGDDGRPDAPALKPDWSPELLLSWRYTGKPVAFRVALIAAAGGVRPLPDGDWEHDLLLRVTEGTSRVSHVAEILCHSRGGRVPRGPGAVVAALDRRGERADVLSGPLEGTWRVHRRLTGRPSVRVIVPFRDSTRLLRACADSIESTAGDGVDLELVLIDNGSTEPETASLTEMLAMRPGVVVRRDDRPFNWAALNNAAAADTGGDVLVFVNDDIEARREGWLSLLVAQALRPEVGAVGARLLYPDGGVQHAGIVVGLGGVTGHVLAGLPPSDPGYLGMAALTRDVSAVTGACLATRRVVFEQLGGFDESLRLDFNDTDYCLRARARGYRVVYEAGAELVHHESPTRGTSGSVETAVAFLGQWGEYVAAGDPFFNRQLSHLDFSAALDGEEGGR